LLVGLSAPRADLGEVAERMLEANSALANALRDLSRQTAELRTARARLERLGALRDEVMTALSHDLRAPLASIGLQAEILASAADAPPGRVAVAAAMIRRNVGRVLDVANAVLDAARLDAGTLALARGEVALRVLAGEVAEALRPLGE